MVDSRVGRLVVDVDGLIVLDDPRRDVVVRDQGPGIPDYADDKVFERFYSLPRPHSQRKSTGLGLPFVKEVAELHHGRVSLRNGEDGGAIATLSLPRLETSSSV